MAGEMSASEVTRENYPLHFAIADAFNGTVQPFDQYQGPYVMVGAADMTSGDEPYAVPVPTRITGGHRLWLTSDDGFELYIYNEANEKKSSPVVLMNQADVDGHAVIDAAVEVTGLQVTHCPICDSKGDHNF